jgi:hypothetical protein
VADENGSRTVTVGPVARRASPPARGGPTRHPPLDERDIARAAQALERSTRQALNLAPDRWTTPDFRRVEHGPDRELTTVINLLKSIVEHLLNCN